MFEGEYKNGKKWKGKEYNSKGKLLFKGKYSNGEKQKGKEYDSEGTLIFKDEYLDGKKWNGKVKEYNDDKLIFDVNTWKEKNGMEKDIIMKETKSMY